MVLFQADVVVGHIDIFDSLLNSNRISIFNSLEKIFLISCVLLSQEINGRVTAPMRMSGGRVNASANESRYNEKALMQILPLY